MLFHLCDQLTCDIPHNYGQKPGLEVKMQLGANITLIFLLSSEN